MSIESRMAKAGSVYIIHTCGGFCYWAVDISENRRSIERAVTDATRNGWEVRFTPPEYRVDKACYCFMETRP